MRRKLRDKVLQLLDRTSISPADRELLDGVLGKIDAAHDSELPRLQATVAVVDANVHASETGYRTPSLATARVRRAPPDGHDLRWIDDVRAALQTANPQTKALVEEALACFEAGYLRAAVVLSWAGAVAILYEHVIRTELDAFNREASRRDAKWRTAKTSDDLARMKDYDFLQVLESISVFGKSVRAELENCLRLRNGCGHPNMLRIGPSRVAAQIETLVLNVFARFV